jgi:hypothetical protein
VALPGSPASSLPQQPAVPWLACLLTALASFLLQLWLFYPILADYYPTLDEIAMQAASTDLGGAIHPSDWFTHGLHGYFVPYPEWTPAAADFWRPLVNAWYWLNHELAGEHWGTALVLGYLVHALVVGLSCYVASSVLQLNAVMTSSVVLIALLNPAYVHQSSSDPYSIPRAIQFPSYQIEVIDALLMMTAVLAFIRRRYLLFSLLATVALLFKETALALPISAALWLLGWRSGERDGGARHLPWLLMPLALWLLGRLVTYLNGAVEWLPPGASAHWVREPLHNLLLWPTGLYQHNLSTARSVVAAHQWSTAGDYALELLINLAWWLALLAAIVAAYGLWVQRRSGSGPAPWIVVLWFALGNLLWVMLLPASELRYGYLWFALGPAAIFAALSRWRLGSAVALVLSLCLLAPQCYSLAQALAAGPLEAYRISKQSARQLTGLLGQLPGTTRNVYLLDDLLVQSSAPEYFAKFAHFSGAIVLVNNLAPVRDCSAPGPAVQRYRLTREGSATSLDYRAPACFEHAWNAAPLDQIDSGGFVQRGRWMNYHFPELVVAAPPPAGGQFDYEPGRRWSLRVKDPSCQQPAACVWLGFDPASRSYYVLTD